MTARACRQESDVRDAVARGRWTADLETHVHDCARCDDTRVVVEALCARMPMSPVSADPRLLWLAARHARRIGAEARVFYVVTAAQVAAFLVIVAALAPFVSWAAVWRVIDTWDPRNAGGNWLVGAAALAIGATIGVARWVSTDA